MIKWVRDLIVFDMENRVFFGKLMLFGEYSIIHGSPALLMPVRDVRCSWDFISEKTGMSAVVSNRNLLSYAEYLRNDAQLSRTIDTDRFISEIDDGLYLKSDIPSGYGMGSSGALVAAVYDRFAFKKDLSHMELKSVFAKMENKFHGNSSGIDPLQCYIGQPFVLNADNSLLMLDNGFMAQNIHLFLVDTKVKGHTGPLVMYFERQRGSTDYLNRFENEYVPCVSECIHNLVAGDADKFFDSLSRLSELQLKLLEPMIPDMIKPLFNVHNRDFRFGIKILGSGGGGYMLGFTDNREKTQYLLDGMRYQTVWIEK